MHNVKVRGGSGDENGSWQSLEEDCVTWHGLRRKLGQVAEVVREAKVTRKISRGENIARFSILQWTA